jgi:hypothetical protein
MVRRLALCALVSMVLLLPGVAAAAVTSPASLAT